MPGKSRQSANLVSVDRITVNPTSRNVGIGSTIPVSFFEVSGNARVTGILTVGINSSIVIDGANGRIGIGSTVSITAAGLSGIAFTSLSDVNIAGLNTVTDGRALIYQNGKWIAGPVIGGYTYTTGDPYIDNVSLLLHMNGSNNSTTFVDNSKNAGINTITTNGNVAISTAQSKFGGASAAFDGTGDYLSISNNSLYNFGTGDFTVEAWVYIAGNSTVNSGGTRYASIVSNVATTPGLVPGWDLGIIGNTTTTGTGLFFEYWNGSSYTIGASVSISQGVWNHITLVRAGSITTIYLNGIGVASGVLGNQDITSTQPLLIGRKNTSGYLHELNGYIDDLRITKGVARYTSNFTPPTAPYPDPFDSDFSKVSLLLHMDGANNSTTFTDSSSNALTVSTFSGAKISTAQSKFGRSSALFNGSTDYLTVPYSSLFEIGSGDVTIECWIYVTSAPSNTAEIASTNASASNGWGLRIDNSLRPTFFVNISNTTTGYQGVTASSTISLNTWTHIAGVRFGNTIYLYVNGVSANTPVAVSGSQYTTSAVLSIGRNTTNLSWYYAGYIDDLRVTKGVARYTTNFTPQNFPFPDSAGVSASLGYTINNLDDVDTSVAPTSGQTLLWNSATSQWVPTTISIGSTQWVTTSAGIHTLSNVGIATTNPIQRFQVGTGSSVIVIDRDGDLGIGITNPISKFQVIGDANISGVVTAQTLNIGIGGTVIATTGIGSVGIGTALPQYRLHVVGSFGATTKSFIINHPTKEGKKLQYGSLEGPENGVYVRGRSQQSVIELPEYWSELVDETSITVNLTPIGMSVVPRVKEISNNQVEVFSIEDGDLDYYYVVFAERKDVEKLEVEI